MTGRTPAGHRGWPRWHAVVAPAIAVVIIVAMTFAAVLVSDGIQRADREYYARELRESSEAIKHRFDEYAEALAEIAAWISTTGWPDLRGFRDFQALADVRSRHPGVQVIALARPVARADLGGYVAGINDQVRKLGDRYRSFEPYPVTSQDQLMVISATEPQVGNEREFGFDLLSEARRRAAVEEARDSGRVTMTAPITLLQETGTQRGILVMVPVYGSMSQPESVDGRRAAFLGLVVAAFRLGDLVEAALGDLGGHVQLFDAGKADGGTPVAENDDSLLFRGEDLDAGAGSVWSSRAGSERATSLTFAGRTWTLRHRIERSRGIDSDVALDGMTGVGVAVGLLAAALVYLLGSSRARAEAMAEKMTAELSSVTESAGDAIVTVDSDHRVVSWNRGAAEMFGLAADAVRGCPVGRILPPGAFGLAAGAAHARVEFQAAGPDGKSLIVEGVLDRWSVPRGEFCTAILRDVTHRRRIEADVRRTSRLLQSVLSAATEVSIIAADPSGRVTVFSEGATRMLGYTSADVVGRMSMLAFHDGDEIALRSTELGVEPGIDALVSVARTGVAETREWTYVREDRSRLPVQVSVTGQWDGQGNLLGFIVVATDLSEQHRMRREHEEIAKWLELLVDSVDEGLCGMGLDGTIVFANRRAATLSGWEVNDLIGRRLHATLHHHRDDGTPYPWEECPVVNVLQGGASCRVDTEVFWHASGRSFPVEYSAAPLRLGDRVTGAVLTFLDISERKRTERALRDAAAAERQAAARLREIDKVRSDLVSTVSHELRTPITSIIGYLEMVLDDDAGTISDEQRAMLEPAYESSTRLAGLVENLLTLSSVEAGAFRMTRRPVDIGEMLRGVARTIRPIAAAQRLVFVVEIADDVGVVRGDETQLGRAVLNLLNNAVKFTPAGGTVSLAARGDEREVVIIVHDTGVGVPETEQTGLFTRFFRSSVAVERAIQGTGLGLSIVKSIVEQHGGSITAESRSGQGTTMTITVPALLAAEANAT